MEQKPNQSPEKYSRTEEIGSLALTGVLTGIGGLCAGGVVSMIKYDMPHAEAAIIFNSIFAVAATAGAASQWWGFWRQRDAR